MNKIIYLLVSIFALFSTPTLAQQDNTPETFTLFEALEIALQNNHDIVISRNEEEINNNNATAGNAGLLPNVTLSGSLNNSVQNTRNEFNDGNVQDVENAGSSIQSISINANYTLFDGFGNYYRFRSLQNLSEQSGVLTRLQIESTLFQVIQFYLVAITSRESIRINQEAIERSIDRYDRAKKQNELGIGTSIDLLNAQVDLNSDSVAYLQSVTDYRVAKRDLLISLGMDPAKNIEITEQLDLSFNTDLGPVLEHSFQQNSSYVLAQLGLNSSSYNLKQERARRFPVIGATGSYGISNSEFDAGQITAQEVDGFSFGLTLSWNLFNGRQQETRIQNALISLKNSEEELNRTKLSLDRDVRNTYDEYTTNVFLVEKELVNLETANLNYKRTQELFQLGQITNAELRNAQLNISRIEERILTLRIQAKISEVELYQLSGKLIEMEDGKINVAPELR